MRASAPRQVLRLAVFLGLASGGWAAEGPALLGPWKQVAPLPVARFIHDTVAVDGFLYVLGGSTGGRPADEVFQARIRDDGTLEAWQAATPLPVRLNYPSAAVVGRRIYVLSGDRDGTPLRNTVFVATIGSDGRIDRWQAATLLPETCRSGGGAAAWQRHLYYVGGFYRRQVYHAPLLEDGLPAPWTEVRHLLAPRMGLRLAVHRDRLYAVGGAKTHPHPTDEVWLTAIEPDGSLRAWGRTTPLPQPNASFALAQLDGVLVVMGGAGHRREVCSALIRPDGHLSAWQPEPPLPARVALSSAAAWNGRIYHTGGWVLQDDGRKTLSQAVHVADVRLPQRFALRFRPDPALVQSLGWLELRRQYLQHPDGTLSIEAEQSTRVALAAADMTPVRDRTASGRRALRHVSELENSLVIDRPGTFQAWYRALFPFRASWNHYECMDDGPRHMAQDSNHGPDQVWLWVRGPTYRLERGEHRYLWPAATAWRGGALLDKIVLVPEGGPPPTDLGPPGSPVRIAGQGELISNRFRLDDFAAWRLEYDAEDLGGRIEIACSYDRGRSWTPVATDAAVPVPAGVKRVIFRIRLTAGPGDSSPRIRNLALVGYPRP